MSVLKTGLAIGTPQMGVWLNLGSAVSAEIASLAGYDWLLIDLEHGSGDYRDLSQQLWAAQAGDASAIVRVTALSAPDIKRVLDLGPHGVMLPNIETVEQAVSAVEAVRIPPLGLRGAATSTRASLYGYGYEAYISEANSSILLAVQIESVTGLANAAEIAAVEGIDVLFVGPLDLSISMGIQEPQQDQRFRDALLSVVQAANRSNKAAGILARNEAEAELYLTMGFRLLASGSDRGILASTMRKGAAALKALASKTTQA
jgi:2-keto-3-deoxy-L-rhamnonate aldolase RhmA